MSQRQGVALKVLLGLSTLGSVAWGVTRVTERQYVFDDAFITFRYAQNLARGNGPVYNVGEPVEGYTNFLWMLFAAAAEAAGTSPLLVSQVIGTSALVSAILLTSCLLLRYAEPSLAGLAVVLIPPTLALPKHYFTFAASGLETSFVAGLCLALGLLDHVFEPKTRTGRALRSAVPLAVVTTRMDASLFVLASMGVVATRVYLGERNLRAVAIELSKRYAVLVAGCVTWLGWKYAYYGELLPNTYYAKAGDLVSLEAGSLYLVSFLRSYPNVIIALPFALIGALAPPRGLRWFGAWAGAALTLYVAYIVKVGGDFMHYRFAFQAYPVYMALAAVGLLTLLERAGALAVVLAALVCLSSPGRPVLETKYGMQKIKEMDYYYRHGKRVAIGLKKSLPKDTIISTGLAGTMSYFSELTNIDELGLNDHYVARLPVKQLGLRARGHLKHAPFSYMSERGVNLVYMHPRICRCAKLCRLKKPTVFTRLDERDCVRGEYLVQTPELTRYFCDRPDEFVLDRVECPQDTKQKGLIVAGKPHQKRARRKKTRIPALLPRH